jgi:two-component system response regulator PilR (NtrC family)
MHASTQSILLLCSPSKTHLMLDELLRSNLFFTLHVSTLTDAKAILEGTRLALIICASVFLDGTFRDVLRLLAQEHKTVPVLVVSLVGRNHECKEAKWLGAADCMPRPFTLEETEVLVKKAIEIISRADRDG